MPTNDHHLYCYPDYANSPKVYRNKSGTCAAGYGKDRDWCTEGHVEHPELNRPGVFTKQNKGDRCPAGFHSYMDKCTSSYAKQATARPKGSGQCRANEIAEWGIWCTSNYQHLSAKELKGAAIRDYNNIAGFTGREPTQSPKSDYSEVYIAMYGDPESKPAATPAAAAGGVDAAASTTDTGPAAAAAATPSDCDAPKAAIGNALGSLFGGGVATEVAKKAVGC